jgi:hypothetical protein
LTSRASTEVCGQRDALGTIFLPQVLMLPLNSGSDESNEMARQMESLEQTGQHWSRAWHAEETGAVFSEEIGFSWVG